MMKKVKMDTDMPVGKLTRVKDMLPNPEELMASDETVKVTLRLSVSSLDFFKDYAKKHHTKYQKMIRRLIDAYAQKHALSH